MIEVGRVRIPREELEFSFTRSSGPGGQNVNKVNSKAVMRWPASTSPSLPPDIRARFLQHYASRLTNEGELVLTCQTHRDQAQNIEACLGRLRAMIAAVAVAPKKRKKTKPSRGSIERRLQAKRQASEKKTGRRGPGTE